jgi:hypothetical protein
MYLNAFTNESPNDSRPKLDKLIHVCESKQLSTGNFINHALIYLTNYIYVTAHNNDILMHRALC